MRTLILTLLLIVCSDLFGQKPGNDNCADAELILSPSNGNKTGVFYSSITDVTNAGREVGEMCSKGLEDFGNCDKTVWYRFYIDGTRNVNVTLQQQDTAIPQIFSGFTIYDIKDCNYSLADISDKLPALNQFGSSGNICLETGWYLIQVAARDRANGLIRIQLQVNLPDVNTRDYHNKVTPTQFYDDYDTYLDFSCAATDSFEAINTPGRYRQCIWYKIVTDPNYLYTISLSGYNVDTLLGYRLFLDSVSYQVQSTPLKTVKGNNANTVYANACGDKVPQVIYLQVYNASQSSNYLGRVRFSRVKFSPDNWNTPDTKDTLVFKSYTWNYSGQKSVNCESLLKNHRCKNILPSSFIYKNPYTRNDDTIRYAGYVILKAEASGRLRIETQWGNAVWVNWTGLYKGDIRKTCNLKPYNFSGSYSSIVTCLDSGETYTLVIGSSEMIDQRLSIRYEFRNYNSNNIQFDKRSQPENNGIYNNSLPDISTQQIDFSMQSQLLVVDTMRLKGPMSFHELSIDQPSAIVFETVNCAFTIVKGHLSKGPGALIPGIRYDQRYQGSTKLYPRTYSSDECFIFPPGDYTIVLSRRLDDSLTARCEDRRHWVNIIRMQTCQTPNNTVPELALPVNAGRDLCSEASAYSNYRYNYQLAYCNDCATKVTFKPAASCAISKTNVDNASIFYYTFFIKENCTFTFLYNTLFDVFSGDASKNRNLLLNPANLIPKCQYANEICNLKGGKTYTIVLYISGVSAGALPIVITPHTKTSNDDITTAEDLGYFNSSRKMKSKDVFVTCNTNANRNDPYVTRSPSIPLITYKDTENTYRTSAYRTIYYTFTAAGNTNVNLYFNRSNNQFNEITVLKCKWPFNTDYQQALASNPDTLSSGFEPVDFKRSSDQITVINKGCQNQRYMVILQTTYLNSYYSPVFNVEAESFSQPIVNQGDHCQNAAFKSISQSGVYTISQSNACHTYGNNAFEEDGQTGIKSTWFKIELKNTGKCDLGFQLTQGYSVTGFNVFAGYCGAMSKLTQQSDRYAYFSLSCMNEGTYFVQVLSQETTDETLSLEVTVKRTPNANCNSYDFKIPLANFKFSGGCQYNDSIRFFNYSTKGSDIEYTWWLNGKKISNKETILLNRLMPEIKDSNSIMLVVRNKVLNFADTQTSVYRLDKRIYQFRIEGDTLVHCYENNVLKMRTDYPERLNHEWRMSPYNYVVGRKDSFISRGWVGTYVLHSESDNCVFEDSIRIRIISSLGKFKDTIICQSGVWPLSPPLNQYYRINDEYVFFGQTYTIKKSGRYIIGYQDSFCWYTDTMNVTIEQGPNTVTIVNNLYNCNVDTMTLKNTGLKLINPYWQNGDTNRIFIAKSSGTYTLRAKLTYCKKLLQTFNVTLEKVNTHLLRDTTICRYDNYEVNNPYGSFFKVEASDPPIGNLVISEPFERTLHVSRGYCNIRDTASISAYKNRSKSMDTPYCESNPVFHFVLDGGIANSYTWVLTGGNQRTEKVNAYGVYPVARTDANHCRDTLSIHLINFCEFNIYVPDVFSPNRDGSNDVFKPVIPSLYQNVSFSIYNRWGQKIYDSDDFEGWDGTYQGEPSEQGVYSYIIRISDKEGRTHLYRGTLTLLR